MKATHELPFDAVYCDDLWLPMVNAHAESCADARETEKALTAHHKRSEWRIENVWKVIAPILVVAAVRICGNYGWMADPLVNGVQFAAVACLIWRIARIGGRSE